MIEDMDICDTPPHISAAPEPTEPICDIGRWFYLDHFGIEQGPSKLAELKKLVEDGYLLSDHLIKHADSNRWVTVENAASPLVPSDFPSLYSDTSTQMVNPPEAPGNLLDEALEEASNLASGAEDKQMEEASAEDSEEFYIDDRVEALMDGSILVHGQELEIIGGKTEVLFAIFGDPVFLLWAGLDLGSPGFFWLYILLELAAKPLVMVSCGRGGNKHASHHDCSMHPREPMRCYMMSICLGLGRLGP